MTAQAVTGLRGLRVVVRGGGDLASAIARRLHLAGARVAVLDLPEPRAVRRTVAFAAGVERGETSVDGVRGVLASEPPAGDPDHVTVIVDPEGATVSRWRPDVVVDARMRKQPPADLSMEDAPLVLGIGPGFVAGVHCHAVIETKRGPDLGRVLRDGSAAPNTGVPGEVGGVGEERVVRAPADGTLSARREIGETVSAGEVLAEVDGNPARARIGGVLRGLARSGLRVRAGEKIGDVDPRGDRTLAFRVSDKANAVAGGVLEAVLARLGGRSKP